MEAMTLNPDAFVAERWFLPGTGFELWTPRSSFTDSSSMSISPKTRFAVNHVVCSQSYDRCIYSMSLLYFEFKAF
jgi:hypothetical protein